MNLDQAMADLAAASSSLTGLGRTVNIDGRDVVCVKRDLTVEEVSAISPGLDVGVEGLRINVDKSLLLYQPVHRGQMVVDNWEYRVARLGGSGNLLRITLTRYTG